MNIEDPCQAVTAEPGMENFTSFPTRSFGYITPSATTTPLSDSTTEVNDRQ